jgi:outer membrane murein-binding lipoprotein Lpp
LTWWEREDHADEIIESGRAALAELTSAANRLNAFVAQLETLIAAEREQREEKGDDDHHA